MKKQSISLNEAIDRDIGKKGTERRDKFDAKVKKELIIDVLKNYFEKWASLIQPYKDLGKAANETAKAFQEIRGPLYRMSIKDTSNRPTLIITGIVILLAIAEIIHFAVYWGIKF